MTVIENWKTVVPRGMYFIFKGNLDFEGFEISTVQLIQCKIMIQD